MGRPEIPEQTYLRAFVKVVPTDPLEQFLDLAQEKLGEEFFTDDHGLIDPKVYTVNSLRVVLFERLLPHSAPIAYQYGYKYHEDASENLRKVSALLEPPKLTERVKNRTNHGAQVTSTRKRDNPVHVALRAANDLYIPGADTITVRASEVVIASKPADRFPGTKLALKIDVPPVDEDGPEESDPSVILGRYSEILNSASDRSMAGKRLPRQSNNDLHLLIPFMEAPFGGDTKAKQYIDTIAPHLPVREIEIAVRSLRWKWNRIDA